VFTLTGDYLIGIGGQKCASTWLFDALARFDGVLPAPRKELDFFSYHHDRGHGWYAGHWRGPGLRLDCSPSYLHDPRAPARLHAFAPDARIVAILRDPVERAYSHHLHEIARGHIAPCAFAEALPRNPDYLAQGLYARHLQPWFDRFGPDRRLVLVHEEVRADPAEALARLAAFLGRGAPPLSPALIAAKNVSDRPRSAALRHGLRAGGRLARRLGLENAVMAVKAVPPVRRLMAWNDRPLRAAIPPLSPDERHRLAAYFAEDVARLAELLGRDPLPWPGQVVQPGGRAATGGTPGPEPGRHGGRAPALVRDGPGR